MTDNFLDCAPVDRAHIELDESCESFEIGQPNHCATVEARRDPVAADAAAALWQIPAPHYPLEKIWLAFRAGGAIPLTFVAPLAALASGH